MLRTLVFAFSTLVTASLAVAQFPAGIGVQSYGPTCEFFGQASSISASYDPTNGMLTVDHPPAQTCCNTFPVDRFLLIGVARLTGAVLPPPFAPGCEVLTIPFATFYSPTNDPWTLSMPNLPPGTRLYAQGVNRYFTTIGFSHDYQTTDGLELTFL